MQELFDALLPDCLDAGLSEFEYWDMSLGEIQRAILSYSRRVLHDRQERAALAFRTADLITAGVATLLSKEAKPPTIFQAFPGLFADEQTLFDAEEADRQAKEYAARFRQFAEDHNRKWVKDE